jgi:PAS domain S-box-containing protein
LSAFEEISLITAPATLGFISVERGDRRTASTGPVRAPDLAELETLVVCAAEGSLVAAGARLGISRPAVAKRIGNLEALAGQPLLHRGRRGVQLTDAGATLLAGARRMLDERDALLGLLAEIRGEGDSPISGLRELLGHRPTASRAAERPEARLAETERMLELILRASATALVISDPDTSIVHEVNEAFCRLTGRPRAELVGRPATESFDATAGHGGLIEEVRRPGIGRTVVRVKRPDGTVRIGETTTQPIVVAGAQQLLMTVDDVTRGHRLQAEREAVTAAHVTLGQLAADRVAGRPRIESIRRILPELRRSGEFATAVLWDAGRGRALFVDGQPPPPQLDRELRRAQPVSSAGVLRLGASNPGRGEASGWAAPLPGDRWVLLLSGDAPADFSQGVFADVLAGLAMIASASGPADASSA